MAEPGFFLRRPTNLLARDEARRIAINTRDAHQGWLRHPPRHLPAVAGERIALIGGVAIVLQDFNQALVLAQVGRPGGDQDVVDVVGQPRSH